MGKTSFHKGELDAVKDPQTGKQLQTAVTQMQCCWVGRCQETLFSKSVSSLIEEFNSDSLIVNSPLNSYSVLFYVVPNF